MNVTILSAFRNAVPQIERYCEQMDGLQALLHRRCAGPTGAPGARTSGDTLRLLLGYGDSTDGTEAALFDECSNRFCAHLIDVTHGGAHYGSIEHPTRFKQLAFVGNRLLEHVPDDADVVGIVESDLIWEPDTLVQLIEDLEHLPPLGAVAPMILEQKTGLYYDIWGHRKNGVRFTKQPPFHAALLVEVEQNPQLGHVISLVEVDSAGSILFMDGDLARVARFSEEEAIVGLCKDIYAHGGGVYLDANATVYHP